MKAKARIEKSSSKKTDSFPLIVRHTTTGAVILQTAESSGTVLVPGTTGQEWQLKSQLGDDWNLRDGRFYERYDGAVTLKNEAE